jgi:hypothetical protein
VELGLPAGAKVLDGSVRPVLEFPAQARHGCVRLLHRPPGSSSRQLPPPLREQRAEASPHRPGLCDSGRIRALVHARQPNLVDSLGRPIDRNVYIRDLPPTVSNALANRFRALQANFPAEQLRQWLTQPEVDGLRARLAVVVTQLDEGAIATVP